MLLRSSHHHIFSLTYACLFLNHCHHQAFQRHYYTCSIYLPVCGEQITVKKTLCSSNYSLGISQSNTKTGTLVLYVPQNVFLFQQSRSSIYIQRAPNYADFVDNYGTF